MLGGRRSSFEAGQEPGWIKFEAMVLTWLTVRGVYK